MKKNNKVAILSIIFAFAILVVGIVTFFVEKSHENLYYSPILFRTQSSLGQKTIIATTKIFNNTEKENSAVTLKIGFYVEGDKTLHEETFLFSLVKGENALDNLGLISFEQSNFKELSEIKFVRLLIPGEENPFNIYSTSEINRGKFFGFSCGFIGFVCLVASVFIYISSKKPLNTLEAFPQKRNEFSPIQSPTIIINNPPQKEEKHEKVVCKFCGSRYNSNIDRCPRCGAPTEP